MIWVRLFTWNCLGFIASMGYDGRLETSAGRFQYNNADVPLRCNSATRRWAKGKLHRH